MFGGGFFSLGLRDGMKRIVKYDLLRIAACFAIVLLHVSNSYWYVVDVDSQEFAVMTVYNSFTRFGVPVFFMLSGLFVLNPEKEFSAKKWGMRIAKLIAFFFIWSLFYAFQSVVFNGITNGWDSVSSEMWSDAMTRLVMGHGHMWYLLDLFGFYLILPILRKVCEDIRVTGYFLLLWVIVRFLITTVLPYIGGDIVIAVTTSMHLYLLSGYIGYFLGGYYLDKTDIPKWARYVIYTAGAGAIVFTMMETLHVCRTTHSYDDRWVSPSNINILIFAIAAFVFFKYMDVPQRIKDSRLVGTMARSTFFVYMIHPFFIEKLGLLGINVTRYPVILSIPIMTVGIFVVAVLLGWLAGRTPVIGKAVTF